MEASNKLASKDTRPDRCWRNANGPDRTRVRHPFQMDKSWSYLQTISDHCLKGAFGHNKIDQGCFTLLSTQSSIPTGGVPFCRNLWLDIITLFATFHFLYRWDRAHWNCPRCQCGRGTVSIPLVPAPTNNTREPPVTGSTCWDARFVGAEWLTTQLCSTVCVCVCLFDGHVCLICFICGSTSLKIM